MPRVSVTSHLARFMPGGAVAVDGATVAAALKAAFALHPGLRGYVLDEHGRLRQHMNVFVDGHPVGDRVTLADAAGPGSEIYIFQALSGGWRCLDRSKESSSRSAPRKKARNAEELDC